MESTLDDLRKKLVHLAFADSTHANRQSHLKSFLSFCAHNDYTAFPITAEVAGRYVAFLAFFNRAHGTIINHIASLKHFHQFYGFSLGWEKDYLFRLTLQGLKRYLSTNVNRKQAITPTMLTDMAELFDLSNPLHAAMWALFLVAFFSFLRKSNLVIDNSSDRTKVLRRSDLEFTSSGARLHIYASKTIQYRQRSLTIPIPSISGSRLCPVTALKHHLRINKIASHEPLFSISSSKSALSTPVTYNVFANFVKRSISALGKDASAFSPHSFRREGATFAFECGLPAELIKLQGDWRSDAYLVYVEMTDAQKQKASYQMANKIRQSSL